MQSLSPDYHVVAFDWLGMEYLTLPLCNAVLQCHLEFSFKLLSAQMTGNRQTICWFSLTYWKFGLGGRMQAPSRHASIGYTTSKDMSERQTFLTCGCWWMAGFGFSDKPQVKYGFNYTVDGIKTKQKSPELRRCVVFSHFQLWFFPECQTKQQLWWFKLQNMQRVLLCWLIRWTCSTSPWWSR